MRADVAAVDARLQLPFPHPVAALVDTARPERLPSSAAGGAGLLGLRSFEIAHARPIFCLGPLHTKLAVRRVLRRAPCAPRLKPLCHPSTCLESRNASRLLGELSSAAAFSASSRIATARWSWCGPPAARSPIAFALLTLIAGTLPAAVAYVGALIVDAVVAAIQADALDRAALTRHALMLVACEGSLVAAIAAHSAAFRCANRCCARNWVSAST